MPVVRILAAVFASFTLSAAAAAQPEGESFEAWLSGFESRLLAEGASPEIVDAMFSDLEPDMRIIERDRSQPEFVRPVWDYLAGAASAERAAAGRDAQARAGAALDAVEARYGVGAEILTAIWGLESAYGAITGDYDIVRSLATLAWEGRRRGFAESQLRAVAEMLEAGYATRDQLTGSWAGAMGQTQFIPTTYLARAVDFDGDGRRDIWSSEADALASAANLLAEAGWRSGAPLVREVVLPDSFDYAAWDERARRQVSAWGLAGVRRAQGEWSVDELYEEARLILPAGAGGPGFLAFDNFDAVMAYNNSTSYALGVSYLARRIETGETPPDGWPLENPPIAYSRALELQRALTALGYDTNGVDGVVGPNTRDALKRFQADRGLPADGYAGRRAFDAVMAAAGDAR